MDDKTLNRFWKKVDKNGPIHPTNPELGRCWLWHASKDANGRGVFYAPREKRGISAHKFIWQQLHGELPDRFDGQPSMIGHTCGNSSIACVNPDHLFLGNAMTAHFRPTLERFWSKVNKNGPIHQHKPELGPCWDWTTGLNHSGYGVFYAGKGFGNILAHRYAWQLVHGTIPEETPFVLHSCDRPSCLNVVHLFLGTQADNMIDMTKKDRRATRVHYGLDHHLTKFSQEIRDEVKRMHSNGHSYDEIVTVTGVSKTHISRIIRGIDLVIGMRRGSKYIPLPDR